MADAQEVKKTVAKVLVCVEKVTSFASSIDPIFGIVSSLVGVARKGLKDDDDDHPLEKDFQAIHTKLESISKKNQQCLNDIKLHEVIETYGQYERYIKHQYEAFVTMVDKVKRYPADAKTHMTQFEKIYESDKAEMSLNVWYKGVMGKATFGRPVLTVYLESCNADRKIMEHRCSYIAHLFHIGLIALMGYTAVTEDDEDEVRDKWIERMTEIQNKMEEVLNMCKDNSS